MTGLGDFQLGGSTQLSGNAASDSGASTVSGSPSGSTPSTSTSAGAQPIQASASTVVSSADTSTTGAADAVTTETDSPASEPFTATSAGEPLTAGVSPTNGTAVNTVASMADSTVMVGSGVVGETTTSVTSVASESTLTGSPVITGVMTSVTTQSSPALLTAETILAPSLSEGISGVPEVLSGKATIPAASTSVTSQAIGTVLEGAGSVAIGLSNPVTAFGTPAQINVSTTTSDAFTKATSQPELHIGEFVLGEEEFGSGLFLKTSMGLTPDESSPNTSTVSAAERTEVTGASITASAVSSVLASVVDLPTMSITPAISDPFTESTSQTPSLTSLIINNRGAIRYLPDWAIAPGPTAIGTVKEETRTFSQMTLEFTVDEELLINNFRPQIQNSGKLEIVTNTDGGFQAVDLASGTNRIELFPPSDHADVRSVDKWLIEGFEETPLGTAAGYYDVELTLVPDKEKAYDNEYGTLNSPPSDTRENDEWLFSFDYGEIATRRVTSDLDKTREGAIDSAELTLILTGKEVRIVEESVSKINAVKEIEVPDGDNDIQDRNSENRNTVDVTVPSVASNTLDSGEYVVTAWETEWNRGLSHEVTITLKK